MQFRHNLHPERFVVRVHQVAAVGSAELSKLVVKHGIEFPVFVTVDTPILRHLLQVVFNSFPRQPLQNIVCEKRWAIVIQCVVVGCFV